MYKKVLVLLWAMPLSASQHDSLNYKNTEHQAIALLSLAISNHEVALRDLEHQLKQAKKVLAYELTHQADTLCLHGLKTAISALQSNKKCLKETLVRNKSELSLREHAFDVLGKKTFKRRRLKKRSKPAQSVVQNIVPKTSFENLFKPAAQKKHNREDDTSSDCDSAGERRTSRSLGLPHKKS